MKFSMSIRPADPEKKSEVGAAFVLLLDIGDQHYEFPDRDIETAFHAGFNHLHTMKDLIHGMLKTEADNPAPEEKPAKKGK